MIFRKKEPDNKETAIIIESVNRTKEELNAAYRNFENVTDLDLVDCYIYEVRSIQKRYEFLLKQAKKNLVKSA